MKWPRWSLFRIVRIADYTDPSRPYLTRFVLLQTPWFGVYLHKIHLPDSDRHLHDHPWSFVSIVLWGGYLELLGTAQKFVRPFVIEGPRALQEWFEFLDHETGRRPRDPIWTTSCQMQRRGWLSIGVRRAEQLHRIAVLKRTPTWTLVLTGRKRRRWGFLTEKGWMRNDHYFFGGPELTPVDIDDMGG